MAGPIEILLLAGAEPFSTIFLAPIGPLLRQDSFAAAHPLDPYRPARQRMRDDQNHGSNGTGMRAKLAEQHKRAFRPPYRWLIALCCLSVCTASALAQTQSQTPRAPSQPAQSLTAPLQQPAPRPPSLPPLETLDRQVRRALIRTCAQEWEELKRNGRASGHYWKEFFESCRLRGIRQ